MMLAPLGCKWSAIISFRLEEQVAEAAQSGAKTDEVETIKGNGLAFQPQFLHFFIHSLAKRLHLQYAPAASGFISEAASLNEEMKRGVAA